MADTIQSSSSLPLPNYQTGRGALDPLPLAGPEQSTRDDAAASTQSQQSSNDAFEDYLNNAAILQFQQQASNHHYNTVTEIENSSVYKPPGATPPL